MENATSKSGEKPKFIPSDQLCFRLAELAADLEIYGDTRASYIRYAIAEIVEREQREKIRKGDL